jgi:hypothetical protein
VLGISCSSSSRNPLLFTSLLVCFRFLSFVFVVRFVFCPVQRLVLACRYFLAVSDLRFVLLVLLVLLFPACLALSCCVRRVFLLIFLWAMKSDSIPPCGIAWKLLSLIGANIETHHL